MNPFPDHGINDPDVRSIADQDMPSAEALLAGTLALMTGIAQGCCDRHRQMMSHKIIANLAQLADHPMASPGFRATAANLRVFWVRLLRQGDAPAGADQATAPSGHAEPLRSDPHRALWHATPETVQ
ncbi:hypothetical protein [Polaromonas hydrogenivorans]|uniref:Uncharacterized protein n=1 Tax=Polaromonas hydrogenivorans TaxID=335476 RepID=A0AAU7LVM9_9BURK